jgi:hypothetical protein
VNPFRDSGLVEAGPVFSFCKEKIEKRKRKNRISFEFRVQGSKLKGSMLKPEAGIQEPEG